jgi:hypothetical protein
MCKWNNCDWHVIGEVENGTAILKMLSMHMTKQPDIYLRKKMKTFGIILFSVSTTKYLRLGNL